MSLLLLKLASLRTLHLLNYLKLLHVDSPSLTVLFLFLIHALLQSLVAAHHFFSVNLQTKSFELSSVTIKLSHSNLALYNIYRPPQSNTKSRHSVSFSQLLEVLQTLISSVSTSPHKFLFTGDFNIHIDDLADSKATQFLSLLDHAHWTQHVLYPTHRHSQTLDLVITSANSTLSPSVISLLI